jgi:hypothetical protein
MSKNLVMTCALVALCISSDFAHSQNAPNLKALGIEYKLQEIKEPRPNRIHALRLDLAKGKIRPAVVLADDPDGDGPAEAALTSPLELAKDQSVVAFVNTNPWDSFPDKNGQRDRHWFEGQPVDISGLAVSASQTRSPSGPNPASVCVDSSGKVLLGDCPDRPVEGMMGFQRIVEDGKLITKPDENRHPRTAIGVDREGWTLWLVVVDGRQEQFSEGMSVHELGQVMLDLGCWNAINMDGGGSSVMGLAGPEGQVRVVNSPSDRDHGKLSIRPLPMVLTIRKTATAD